MIAKPNYKRQRSEREMAKRAKMEEKEKAKAVEAAKRRAPQDGHDDEDGPAN